MIPDNSHYPFAWIQSRNLIVDIETEGTVQFSRNGHLQVYKKYGWKKYNWIKQTNKNPMQIVAWKHLEKKKKKPKRENKIIFWHSIIA